MKNELDRYYDYHSAYESLMLVKITENALDVTCNIEQVRDSIQRNVDQGATESFGDTPEDQSCKIPWVIVNGVTRRYGYSR